MQGQGFFPDFDPCFGLKVDHSSATRNHGSTQPVLKLGPSCNDRIGPAATMFLVEWWKAVGCYPLVLHLVPRAAGPWRERLGNVPKEDAKEKHTTYAGKPAEIWLNVPDFSARSEETRRARIANFSTTVNVETSKDHALAEPDDFIVWQLTSSLSRYLIHKSTYSYGKDSFPVFSKKLGSTDMRLGLPLRKSKEWAYCNETSASPASASALRSIVNDAEHRLGYLINTAAESKQDRAHFEIDLRPAREALEAYDRLREMALTPPKLAWAAVERFRRFRGNPDAIDAEAFVMASGFEQIQWLQHPA